MNKGRNGGYLRAQIELYHTIALDESHRDVYRIRCYGMARGFQMTLAMLTGELTDIIPIKVKGELIQMTKKRDYFWWIIVGFIDAECLF